MNGNIRKIRSFVRRPGRMTQAQQRALETLLPRWGLPHAPGRIDLDQAFGRRALRVLDIGFGDGEALVTSAANQVDIDYLGIEVHEPGVGHLLMLLERAGLANVRVIVGDAVEVVTENLDEASVDVINIFFPDPWPKKRHHKRRLLQPDFLDQCCSVLKDGGFIHFATDWADYAEHALAVLGTNAMLVAESAESVAPNRLSLRPPSKFERRGIRLGHDVVDLYFRKQPVPAD